MDDDLSRRGMDALAMHHEMPQRQFVGFAIGIIQKQDTRTAPFNIGLR
jgi:hypothetical protein